MLMNTYWHLEGKQDADGSQFIIELTPDGVAYVWPVNNNRRNVISYSKDDQDLDALLADGDFLEHHGFYHSIADFMDHSQYSSERYNITAIGEMESIRACRVALANM